MDTKKTGCGCNEQCCGGVCPCGENCQCNLKKGTASTGMSVSTGSDKPRTSHCKCGENCNCAPCSCGNEVSTAGDGKRSQHCNCGENCNCAPCSCGN